MTPLRKKHAAYGFLYLFIEADVGTFAWCFIAFNDAVTCGGCRDEFDGWPGVSL